jgi:hypothetical protein
MLLVDDIHTLINVVIANPTGTYLVLHVDSFRKVVTTMVFQAKEGVYQNSSLCQKGFWLFALVNELFFSLMC